MNARLRAAGLAAACMLAALLIVACQENGELITPEDPAVLEPPPPTPTPTAAPTVTPTETPVPSPEPGPEVAQPVASERVFDHTTFNRPVEAGAWPHGGIFVVEQSGVVYLLNEEDAHVLLDFSDAVSSGFEEGLLSLSIDPAFEETDHVWAYYSASPGPTRTVLSRFEVGGDGLSIERESELIVLEIEQPYTNHNGGAIRFGPDTMLYLGIGDGGSGGDPHGHGQNTQTLLGTIIRLDVSQASADAPYRVPPDNPFIDDPDVLDEIWAYGLRNPWRMDFDPVTGLLWVGDVGQADVEEVSIAEAGDNLGWAIMEGDICYPPGTACETEGLKMPLITYQNTGARCSITGGVVYRGTAVPELTNAYLFSDWCSGELWAVNADDGGEVRVIAEGLGSVTSFAVGPDDEIYVVAFERPLQRLVSP